MPVTGRQLLPTQDGHDCVVLFRAAGLARGPKAGGAPPGAAATVTTARLRRADIAYFAVYTISTRRFCCQQDSFEVLQVGRSSP